MPELKRINPLRFLRKTDNTSSVSLVSNRLVVAEHFVAIALTLLTIFLQSVFLIKAGGFWRDEANSIALALRPSLSDAWSSLKFDSFPFLHVLIVRLWSDLFGSSDSSLRTLGFAVGISIITAIWCKSREFGSRVPLISLLIIGMSPVMIRSLDSIRPYGIAAITTILAFATVWRAVKKPGPVHISMATLALVLCVQTLYQSAIFVLGIGIAAISVGFLRGGFRQAALLSLPFCMAAISLLPYAGHLQEAQNWSPVVRNPVRTDDLMPAFLDAVRSPTHWSMWVWTAALVLAVAGAIKGFARKRSGENGEQAQDHLLLYCGITFVISCAGFLGFFIYVAGPISFETWHLVPLLVIAVVSLEAFVENVVSGRLWRVCYLLAIAAVSAAIILSAARNLTVRMTSMDLAASVIGQEARPNDLVIVNPWFYGVSFNRYYRGSAPWTTFPGLREPALHRYDVIKERMKHPEAISDEIARVSSTLQRGGRVWVVGWVHSRTPGLFITTLPPPPLPLTGWSSEPYIVSWNEHLINTLEVHSLQAEMVPIAYDRMINPLESPDVAVFLGWRH